MSDVSAIKIELVQEDALNFPCDVIALKYARSLYGLDAAVVASLESANRKIKLPALGKSVILATEGLLAANSIIFMGVPALREFGYAEIREFGKKVCRQLKTLAPEMQHLALTVNGPGYGLDEVEAFESVLAGIVDAISNNDYPRRLRRVSFVERDSRRVQRLTPVLKNLFPKGDIEAGVQGPQGMLESSAQRALSSVGQASASKPKIFVAMSFAPEMDDVFHYGIQGAANAAGMLCERADLSVFTGDVIEWVRRSIKNATLVVADLSGANANVYLEIGYAWGCNVPTVLLCKKPEVVKFNVQGQRYIGYSTIKSLEEGLSRELKGLLKS